MDATALERGQEIPPEAVEDDAHTEVGSPPVQGIGHVMEGVAQRFTETQVLGVEPYERGSA